MPYFSSITFEVLISGSWVDLSADVRQDPAPKFSRGIQGNKIDDRVADPGRLTFSLNNSAANSAGLVGYYSPGHTNCLTGWTTSLPVRLTFAFDTWSIVKWYGHIEPDGIKPYPGIYDDRRVDVSCVDFMGRASRHRIELLTPQADLYASEAIEYVLDNMPERPLDTDYYPEAASLLDPMSAVFDVSGTETTAISEFQKIASSQRLYVYVRGKNNGETLSTQLQHSTSIPLATADVTDNLLLESGDNLLLENGSLLLLEQTAASALDGTDLQQGTEFSYGAGLINFLTITTYPRRIDASAVVLWTMESATQLDAGESVTIRATYRDPTSQARVNCLEGTAPVATTDYAAYANSDGTGTNYTANLSVSVVFGSAEAEVTLTNTHASASFYTGGEDILFQLRGKGIYTYDTVREVFKDTTSMNTHGVQPYTIDMKYQDGITITRFNSGAQYIANYKNPRLLPEKVQLTANKDNYNMSFFLFMEPHSVVRLSEDVTGVIVSTTYWMQGYEAEIQPGGIVSWSMVLTDNIL